MASLPHILAPDRGKAHSVALAVLCGLAVVQIGAMVRAVWLVKSRQGDAIGTGTSAFVNPPVPATPMPSSSASIGAMAPPPVPSLPPMAPTNPPSMAASQAISAFSHSATAAPSTGSLPAKASNGSLSSPGALPTPKESTAPLQIGSSAGRSPAEVEVDDLVQVAQQVRSLGDLQGTLEVLRKADLKLPDHPAVLTEMAQTYDQMGLTDKALATWKKIEGMGARAGEFHIQARKRLGGAPAGAAAALSPATGLTTPDPKPPDPSRILGLGACVVHRDPAVTRGEKLALRIPIQSRPGAAVDPKAVDIDVFYFDLVNGEKIEQTKADTVSTWVNAPVDWQEGTELLDVGYFLPEMTPDEIRNNGRRKFHGYIVKLYYEHKLQDTAAEPASLLNQGPGGQQPAGNPLLPPLAR